ncbi:hypothetical protein Leryth_014972 [Lithospermum erythrorhizon]|nr:hypothetical protein Leryth_014972 [Lithospermum erythrorhizon]
MSFLRGRSAGQEGAYFLQESKQAVSRMIQKHSKPPDNINNPVSSNPSSSSADVLPEILKHSLPPKILKPCDDQIQSSSSSSTAASKWVIQTGNGKAFRVSQDTLNPLRAFVSLPQTTFGPKRWQLPNGESSALASTANELRRDKYVPLNPEKMKAAAVGLSQIAKAFAVATAIIFGGATLAFGVTVSKLELHSVDDIRTKGKDLLQPQFDSFKEQAKPLRAWADNKSRKWHFEKEENLKEKPLIKELSKRLGGN